MSQAEFELCSYSISFAEKCDNYGSRFCKTCDRYWCNDHRCVHILALDSMDIERCEESETSEDIDTSVGFHFLSTSLLRSKRDKLFAALKAVQTELDLREDSHEALKRELSEVNLDKYLKESYEHLSHGKQSYKRISRRDQKFRSNRTRNISSHDIRLQPKQGRRAAEEAVKVLFNGFTKEQIKAFISRYGKE